MDNCAVISETHVIYALASDLRVSGGSVFSIQNSSWGAPSTKLQEGACVFRDVAVAGGSVLQIVSSTFRLGFAMLIATTLTVTGDSWLVHRDNEFRTAYVVYVAKYDGVAFRDRSVWSILDNNITYGSYSSTTAYMTSRWLPPSDSRPTIYGVCNEAVGSPVTNYREELNIGTPVTVLDLWTFNAPQQTLNITLLQCVLMGLSIKGSGARVH
ncbi:dispersed gene family protein 1 (DGF-1), putative, partial [Trypanosoma cruzi]